MSVNGWPFVNHATNLRLFNSVSRTGAETGVPMAIPRYRFTWLAEFVPNDTGSITNLPELGLRQGHLYTHLKTVGLPNPTFKTETLNSYNRRYKVQTKMEMPQFSMIFHDDSTSFAMALVKELVNHANHVGDIGNGPVNDLNKNINQGLAQYQAGTTGVETFINPDRSELAKRPSLGMRIQDCSRTWLSHVIIYDLGTEPDSINVYIYHNPMLVGLDHTPLDMYDRTSFGEVNLTFEYENYYFMIGQPHAQVRDFVSRVLGVEAPAYRSSNIHGKQGTSFEVAQDLSPMCLAQCGTPNPKDHNLDVTGVIEKFIDGGVDSVTRNLLEDAALFRNQLLPSQGGLRNAPKLDYEDSQKYVSDRRQRAENNYSLYYGGATEDSPEAAIRRDEIDNLRALESARVGGDNYSYIGYPPATKSATTNTEKFYELTKPERKNMSYVPDGGLTPTGTVVNPVPRITPTPIQRNYSTPEKRNYSIPNAGAPFADFNQNFMRTFKSGVTK